MESAMGKNFNRARGDAAGVDRQHDHGRLAPGNDRTLSGLPPTKTHDLREISHGAVLIGPFEGSRWRGGCGESYGISMGASPSRGGLAAEQASVEKRRFVEVA